MNKQLLKNKLTENLNKCKDESKSTKVNKLIEALDSFDSSREWMTNLNRDDLFKLVSSTKSSAKLINSICEKLIEEESVAAQVSDMISVPKTIDISKKELEEDSFEKDYKIQPTVRNALAAANRYREKYGRLDWALELQAKFNLEDWEMLWLLDKVVSKNLIDEYEKERIIEYLNLKDERLEESKKDEIEFAKAKKLFKQDYYTNPKNELERLANKIDDLSYIVMAYVEDKYIIAETLWRTTQRQAINDYVKLQSFLNAEVCRDFYNLTIIRIQSRDNGKEFDCKLRIELKNVDKSSEKDYNITEVKSMNKDNQVLKEEFDSEYNISLIDAKKIIQWWKDLDRKVFPVDLRELKDLNNIDEWLAAMYDALSDLTYEYKKTENEDFKELLMRGKKLYNKYAMSKYVD